ncbi:hypothetical protein BGZ73_003527 [Actinomortierella ambigua]|nr:hypothetical protein BGZ73_003527 [Actinomortierella ambigua]
MTKFTSLNGATPADVKAKILADPTGAKFDIKYFQIAGGAITARDILAYAGVDWKCSYPEGWPQGKAATPFGVLPMLTIEKDGHQVLLGESGVIDQYLARQFGLMGSNLWEEKYIAMLYSSSSSMIERVSSRYIWNHEDAREDCLRLMKKTILPEWVAAHEGYLMENGNNGHYLGDKLSLADIRTASVLLHWSHQANPEKILDLIKPDSPLWKLKEAVENEPRLKTWHESDEYKMLVANSLMAYKNAKMPAVPKDD